MADGAWDAIVENGALIRELHGDVDVVAFEVWRQKVILIVLLLWNLILTGLIGAVFIL